MFDFLGKTLKTVFGDKAKKDLGQMGPMVDLINEEYAKLTHISHDELREKTNEFKAKIKAHLSEIDAEIESHKKNIADHVDMSPDEKEIIYKAIDELDEARDEQIEEKLAILLPEAFAVVRETTRRFKDNESLIVKATDLDKELAVSRDHMIVEGDSVTYKNSWIAAGNETQWAMVHYDVQLIGGIVLHEGKIAEMATGEGKTLVATLPAYLNALVGNGVHIITVNDYLARRDSEWMAPIFEFLGITVDCIDKYRPHSPERIAAYNADITYGTNNEYGFDYLRDNMTRNPSELVQRKQHYAMIDEVDSVLVDDARTPLIISGPIPKGDQHEFHELKPRIEKLLAAQRKIVTKSLTDAKKLIAENKIKHEEGGLSILRAYRGLPKHKPLIKYLSEQGNKVILQKSENHYMAEQNKHMPIVDEELFFVIDEKQNSVDLTEKGIELITGTGEDPHFFIMPNVGDEVAILEKSNLSDEEKIAAKDKLMTDFSIKSERIHAVQQLLKAYSIFERDDQYIVVDNKVKIVDEQTGRVMEGRRYSDGLHQAIEAKENVKVEAATQTMATITLQNFFRMYHKLSGMTGTAETEAGEFWEIYKLDVVVIPTNRPIVRNDDEDLVYRTQREKFNAVIEEIIRLTDNGQPVLVGTTSVEISELLSRMLNMKGLSHNVLNAKQHAREADVVAEAGLAGKVTIATNMAGRGTDIKLGPGVKEAGGLAIVGTERHESRRVDRQLRGRAGRQGDPGSSQFFVSLEDGLMRMFGSDRIAGLMDRMGYKEGEVIQHKMVSKSIERAQKKVEENNFGIRKRLLEYDDVMNSQREVIYKKRKHALFGERLSVDISNMIEDLCEEITHSFHEVQDYEGFKMDVIRNFALEPNMDEQTFLEGKAHELTEELTTQAKDVYARKMHGIMEMALPVINDLYKTKGKDITNVAVPFTDGRKQLQVVAHLEDAHKSECRSLVKEFEKSTTLAFIDEAWKEHLREMDDLKQSVQNATYEQKDPLLVYKFESFEYYSKSCLTPTIVSCCHSYLKGEFQSINRMMFIKHKNNKVPIIAVIKKVAQGELQNEDKTDNHSRKKRKN